MDDDIKSSNPTTPRSLIVTPSPSAGVTLSRSVGGARIIAMPKPVRGEIRLANPSSQAISGQLQMTGGGGINLTASGVQHGVGNPGAGPASSIQPVVIRNLNTGALATRFVGVGDNLRLTSGNAASTSLAGSANQIHGISTNQIRMISTNQMQITKPNVLQTDGSTVRAVQLQNNAVSKVLSVERVTPVSQSVSSRILLSSPQAVRQQQALQQIKQIQQTGQQPQLIIRRQMPSGQLQFSPVSTGQLQVSMAISSGQQQQAINASRQLPVKSVAAGQLSVNRVSTGQLQVNTTAQTSKSQLVVNSGSNRILVMSGGTGSSPAAKEAGGSVEVQPSQQTYRIISSSVSNKDSPQSVAASKVTTTSLQHLRVGNRSVPIIIKHHQGTKEMAKIFSSQAQEETIINQSNSYSQTTADFTIAGNTADVTGNDSASRGQDMNQQPLSKTILTLDSSNVIQAGSQPRLPVSGLQQQQQQPLVRVLTPVGPRLPPGHVRLNLGAVSSASVSPASNRTLTSPHHIIVRPSISTPKSTQSSSPAISSPFPMTIPTSEVNSMVVMSEASGPKSAASKDVSQQQETKKHIFMNPTGIVPLRSTASGLSPASKGSNIQVKSSVGASTTAGPRLGGILSLTTSSSSSVVTSSPRFDLSTPERLATTASAITSPAGLVSSQCGLSPVPSLPITSTQSLKLEGYRLLTPDGKVIPTQGLKLVSSDGKSMSLLSPTTSTPTCGQSFVSPKCVSSSGRDVSSRLFFPSSNNLDVTEESNEIFDDKEMIHRESGPGDRLTSPPPPLPNLLSPHHEDGSEADKLGQLETNSLDLDSHKSTNHKPAPIPFISPKSANQKLAFNSPSIAKPTNEKQAFSPMFSQNSVSQKPETQNSSFSAGKSPAAIRKAPKKSSGAGGTVSSDVNINSTEAIRNILNSSIINNDIRNNANIINSNIQISKSGPSRVGGLFSMSRAAKTPGGGDVSLASGVGSSASPSTSAGASLSVSLAGQSGSRCGDMRTSSVASDNLQPITSSPLNIQLPQEPLLPSEIAGFVSRSPACPLPKLPNFDNFSPSLSKLHEGNSSIDPKLVNFDSLNSSKDFFDRSGHSSSQSASPVLYSALNKGKSSKSDGNGRSNKRLKNSDPSVSLNDKENTNKPQSSKLSKAQTSGDGQDKKQLGKSKTKTKMSMKARMQKMDHALGIHRALTSVEDVNRNLRLLGGDEEYESEGDMSTDLDASYSKDSTTDLTHEYFRSVEEECRNDEFASESAFIAKKYYTSREFKKRYLNLGLDTTDVTREVDSADRLSQILRKHVRRKRFWEDVLSGKSQASGCASGSVADKNDESSHLKGRQRRKTKKKMSALEINNLKRHRLWMFIIKKEVGKGVKARNFNYKEKQVGAKRLATACMRVQRQKAAASQKAMKEAIWRAKRITREMQAFWKKSDREEKQQKRAKEKVANEQRKQHIEILEAKRQQRKLNFLITQTELYAHFMAKKMGHKGEDTEGMILAKLNNDIHDPRVKELDDYDETRVKAEARMAAASAARRHEAIRSGYPSVSTSVPSPPGKEMDLRMSEAAETAGHRPQPSIFKGKLKTYQLKGMNWLCSLYDQGINGILADEMGLGKTVQSLAFLAHVAETYGVWGPFLVITPASTLHNWQQEAARFIPDLKVVPYWGSPQDRKVMRGFWSQNNLHTKEASFHIVITSYQIVITDNKYFNRFAWQYMVLDEAQAIKSASSQRWKMLLEFKCRGRLLLSGTPIQNTMAELWSLLHFVMPALFDSHDEFKEWFSKDIESHAEGSKSKVDEKQMSRLHLILKPFMLRRVKKDVEHELTDKVEVLVYCPLTIRQKLLYAGLKQNIRMEELLAGLGLGSGGSSGGSSVISNAPNGVSSLMNLVMQFRKVCNHPELFERREPRSPLYFPLVDLQLPRLAVLDPPHQPRCVEKFSIFSPTRVSRAVEKLDECDNSFDFLRIVDLSPGELELQVVSLYHRILLLARRMAQNLLDSYSWTKEPCDIKYLPSDLILPNLHLPKDLLFTGYKSTFLSHCDHVISPLSSTKRPEDSSRSSWPYANNSNFSNEHHPQDSFNCSRSKKDTSTLVSNVTSVRTCVPTTWPKFLLRNILAGKSVFSPPRYYDCSSRAAAYKKIDHQRVWVGPGLEDTAEAMIKHGFSLDSSNAALLQRIARPWDQDQYSNGPYLNPDRYRIRGLWDCLPSASGGWSNIAIPDRLTLITDAGKLFVLDRLLGKLKQEGHRVLIYSQMTKMIDLLEEFMSHRQHTYIRLDGSSKISERRDMVADFQAREDIFVFLLSTRAGGLGINLTAADTVIFYDSDWNPTVDQQAMDRAHRLGQTRQVTVYRLICKGTIEERILQRAREKSEIHRMVIQGGSFKGRSGDLKPKEVVSLLLDDSEMELKVKEKLEVSEDSGVSQSASDAVEADTIKMEVKEEVMDDQEPAVHFNSPDEVANANGAPSENRQMKRKRDKTAARAKVKRSKNDLEPSVHHHSKSNSLKPEPSPNVDAQLVNKAEPDKKQKRDPGIKPVREKMGKRSVPTSRLEVGGDLWEN